MGLPPIAGQETATRLARTSPEEIVSLTSLRGYLAVWVVVYHFWNDVLLLFPWSDALSPVARVGNMAVPAFFMLSGFVLAYNYADRFLTPTRRDVSLFLWSRLARIYPVHLVTLLIVAAMVGVSNRAGYQLTDAGYTTRDFVLNLFLVQTWVPDFQLNWNYPSWSISSEWFAYLFFPLAVPVVLGRLTTPVRAVGFGVTALLTSIAVMLWWRPWPFYDLVLVVPTFFAGAAAYWMISGQQRGKAPVGWRRLPGLLVVAVVASCFLPSHSAVTAALLCCFLATIVSLVWVGNGQWMWTARPAVFLGEVSYSLYMTHTLAQKIVYRLLPAARFEEADPITKSGVLLIYVGLVVVFCLTTFYVVETPCRRMFKRAMRGEANPAEASPPIGPIAAFSAGVAPQHGGSAAEI